MSTCLLSFRRLVSSAHLYSQPKWSDQKNREEFGLCYSQHGHGHNYEIDFSWRVSEMPSNLYADFLQSARATMDTVCAIYDHKHLSFTHPSFRLGANISTTENLALQIWSEFQNTWPKKLAAATPSGVLLWEMATLASSLGTTPENAAVELDPDKKSYVEQIKTQLGLRLGTKLLPVSLEIQIPAQATIRGDEHLKRLQDFVSEQAKHSESLPDLARLITKQFNTPVLLRDLENHCAFCTP